MEVIKDCRSRKHENIGKQQAFLKKKLCQKSYGIAQPKQKPAKNIEKVGSKTLD
jgi:hypothetical protein